MNKTIIIVNWIFIFLSSEAEDEWIHYHCELNIDTLSFQGKGWINELSYHELNIYTSPLSGEE